MLHAAVIGVEEEGLLKTKAFVLLRSGLQASESLGAELQRDPADAAAVAFNAAGDQLRSIKGLLIEHAAAHADSHLAKYTMACLIAVDRDPEESALYLAAAAYLGKRSATPPKDSASRPKAPVPVRATDHPSNGSRSNANPAPAR